MYYFYHSADAIGTIRRALIDKSQWVNRPLVFINRNALASRMTAGMFEVSPGMMIEKHTGENVLEVNDALSRFNPEVLSVLGVFEGDMAMSGHNELLHGGASPRGRTTAEEIITRRTMLGAQQQFLVQMLETALSKLFTKVRNHILQYQPVEDWLDLGTVFGDNTDPALPPEKAQEIAARKEAFMKFFKGKEGEALRYAMVREPNVIISGVTAAYKRTQESEALSMVMKLFFENPLAAFAMGIDPARVGKEFLWRIDGIDPNALIVADEEQRRAIIETAVQAITSIALGQAGQAGMQGVGGQAEVAPAGAPPGVGAVSPGVQGRK